MSSVAAAVVRRGRMIRFSLALTVNSSGLILLLVSIGVSLCS